MSDYRNSDCKYCGRMRVELDGICEKCGWDNDEGKWSEPRPMPFWTPVCPKRGHLDGKPS